MKFIGRQRELQALEHFHNTPEAGLLILFGRRPRGENYAAGAFHGEPENIHWILLDGDDA